MTVCKAKQRCVPSCSGSQVFFAAGSTIYLLVLLFSHKEQEEQACDSVALKKVMVKQLVAIPSVAQHVLCITIAKHNLVPVVVVVVVVVKTNNNNNNYNNCIIVICYLLCVLCRPCTLWYGTTFFRPSNPSLHEQLVAIPSVAKQKRNKQSNKRKEDACFLSLFFTCKAIAFLV